MEDRRGVAVTNLHVLIYRVLDLVLIGASLFLSLHIRNSFHFISPESPPEMTGQYLWYLAVALYIWWHLLRFNNVYTSYRARPVRNVILAVLKANILGSLLVGSTLFFLHAYWIHRSLLPIFFVVCTTVLIIEKLLLFFILGKIRKSDRNLKYALIVGMGDRARNLIRLFRERTESGYRIAGVIGNNPDEVGSSFEGLPILGTSQNISQVLHNNVVDDVFVALSMRHVEDIERIIDECSEFGIDVHLEACISRRTRGVMLADRLFSTPFITFTRRPANELLVAAKGTIDMVGASVLLVLFSPLLIIIPVLIKLDSKGPVIYRQARMGNRGRQFLMYKFRSMVDNAESQRMQLACHNEMNGPVFKIRDDPRITRVGRILRKTSLDELPQLFNVLKRDMSLIGPRPLPVYEAAKIYGSARRRHAMKPGVTGLWQVSGRNNVDFNQWMQLDLQYVDNWSLKMDMCILFRTLWVWLSGKGAC